MKIIIAMDSFKGSMSALDACHAAKLGIQDSGVPTREAVLLPVSDGGEGMLSAITHASGYVIEQTEVTGPLHGMRVMARIGYSHDGTTAIIESAQACGLHLLASHQRNPLLTTTAGVGEMILQAVRRGCTKILIGLGGSATNDLGTGMLSALGVEFLDKENRQVTMSGATMSDINTISLPNPLPDQLSITIASDVNNPLLGTRGAAFTFAPQKGATPHMVTQLEQGAMSLSTVIDKVTGRSCASLPGAGAAGGLGYALMSFFNCRIESGAKTILDILDFDAYLKGASLVITGEGHSDSQTLMGKIPQHVMQQATARGIKTILLSGGVSDSTELLRAGFHRVATITPTGQILAQAMERNTAMANMARASRDIITQIASSL